MTLDYEKALNLNGWDTCSENQKYVRANRRLSVSELDILIEKLNVHRIAAKSVPRLMTEQQRKNRVEVFRQLFKQVKHLDKNWIITVDWQRISTPKKHASLDLMSKWCLLFFFVCLLTIFALRSIRQPWVLWVSKRLCKEIHKRKLKLQRDNSWQCAFSVLYQKSDYCCPPSSLPLRPGSPWHFLFPIFK